MRIKFIISILLYSFYGPSQVDKDTTIVHNTVITDNKNSGYSKYNRKWAIILGVSSEIRYVLRNKAELSKKIIVEQTNSSLYLKNTFFNSFFSLELYYKLITNRNLWLSGTISLGRVNYGESYTYDKLEKMYGIGFYKHIGLAKVINSKSFTQSIKIKINQGPLYNFLYDYEGMYPRWIYNTIEWNILLKIKKVLIIPKIELFLWDIEKNTKQISFFRGEGGYYWVNIGINVRIY